MPLWGDSSTGQFRPQVPEHLQKQVFDQVHNTAHPGRCATRRLLAAR
jgi:hypothetical protein